MACARIPPPKKTHTKCGGYFVGRGLRGARGGGREREGREEGREGKKGGKGKKEGREKRREGGKGKR